MSTHTLQRTPFTSAVWIIAKREIITRLTSKGFVFPTLLVLVLILLGSVLGPRASELISSTDQVAVTQQTQPVIAGLGDGYETELVGDASAARDAVANGEVDYAVVASADNPTGLQIIADREAPTTVLNMLAVVPDVELLDANAPDPMLVYFIGLGFGLVFFFSALTFGMTIAQSVVEEKQSRIVEILLATVPARAILAGKVLGCSLLAFTQVALYAAAGLLGLAVNGDQLNLEGLGAPIIWFVILFIFAFISLAAQIGRAHV